MYCFVIFFESSIGVKQLFFCLMNKQFHKKIVLYMHTWTQISLNRRGKKKLKASEVATCPSMQGPVCRYGKLLSFLLYLFVALTIIGIQALSF